MCSLAGPRLRPPHLPDHALLPLPGRQSCPGKQIQKHDQISMKKLSIDFLVLKSASFCCRAA